MNTTYPFDNVVDALHHAAQTSEGIIAYQSSGPGILSTPVTLSYEQLLHQAETNAHRLQHLGLVQPGAVVLTHFDKTIDTCVWYWSVLLAGGIPAVTAPGMFSANPLDRQKHLQHLHRTLNGPLCLTRRALLDPFREQALDDEHRIHTRTVEEILEDRSVPDGKADLFSSHPADTIALVLTSGSSGNAKAVPLTNQQVLAAFRGKTDAANLRYPKSPFLSWVHMDHVANLAHCHLFAIVAGVSQVQVPPSNILVDPIHFLNLISRHRVSRTFAPNFLLAKLRRQLELGKTETLDADLNLETLYLDTGGEANIVEVCVALQELLGSKYGAPKNFFCPSFGMSETIGGCIFNSHCPTYDQEQRLEFASLGQPMAGVQMRVSPLDGSATHAPTGERGHLELTGEVVFKGYYNNEAATAEAFTADGWFRTGDLAYIDAQGHMHLDGRSKEMININGVKYLPHEVDAALEQANITGATPSYFCSFGTRDAGNSTEVVAVLYLPTYNETDDAARAETHNNILRVVSMQTRSRPLVVPLCIEDMPKSTLGKLSRAKLKTALESNQFAAYRARNEEAIDRYRQQTRGEPKSEHEAVILQIVRNQLDMAVEDDFSVNDPLLATGATSMDLVAIMQRINRQLELPKSLVLTDILNYPTVRGLAERIGATIDGTVEYDPVVTLQPYGSKTPLWLVHPGVGEVLVFVTLAHHITDRPVYAFRAKGFNAEAGETPFGSLDEVFETYKRSIKKRQPQGPYAIAGYSFGGMVAFEVTKRLEADGDEVRYCGSWNLPPHIKFRMRELLWDECVIHLFYFVGLMDEATAYTHKQILCAYERDGQRLEAIRYLRRHCDQDRWEQLGLTEEYYLLWVGLASNMQGLAVDYDPSGSVKCMDIMVADPLSHVAKDRQDWIESRLSAWKDFVREDVLFHHVQGAHYTMLNPEYVANFATTLRGVLKARSL